MECLHKDISTKKTKKEVLGMIFEAKTEVCSKCGAVMRGMTYEKKYLSWLEAAYKEKRDKFQIQCHFSKELIDCAELYLENYPGIPLAVFIRILATIYLNVVDKNEKKSLALEKLLDKNIYNSLKKGTSRKKITIQFKPKMMIEIDAISDFLDMSSSEILEEIVIKLMTFITCKDEKVRQYWENEIREYLDMFLKAA